MSSWQADLVHAARTARCRFSCLEVIGNEAHARVATALFKAFGRDAACSILPEARTPDRLEHENARPADVLILHPELGVLFIEVKSWRLAEIITINAGTVYRNVNGQQEAKDLWNQVANASQQLQNATRKIVRHRKLSRNETPFFDCLVAFPNITRAGWIGKGYGGSLNGHEVLFKEDLTEPEVLRVLLLGRLRLKAGRRLPCSPVQLNNVRWALGDSDVINRKRPQVEAAGMFEAIDIAELQQNRFSREQQDLADAEWDGRPQLVRGVAGSGKTAVLIKNFANMLDRKLNMGQMTFGEQLNHKRFLIVCFNHSLVPLLRQKLEDAFHELTHQSLPDCVDIFVMNEVEYVLCQASDKKLQYQHWKQHVDRPGDSRSQRFASAYCRQLDALVSANDPVLTRLRYDAVYVDEGQDFFIEEFKLLVRLVRPDPSTGEKNIVIFYDDAQNLYGRPRPVWIDLGLEVRGRTAVMKTCLRNPKQVLEFAFNLLLGTAAETRVLTRGFADTLALKESSLVEELPDRWLVHFAPRIDGEFPKVTLFATREAEVEWVIAKLDELINKRGVDSKDIMLVSEEPWKFLPSLEKKVRSRLPKLKRILKPYGDSSNPDKNVYILESEALTLATVKAAKGYDCPIVLLIGADLFPNSVEGRASFYVAATRAKMRLFVTGLRIANTLAEEAEKVATLLATPPIPITDAHEVPALATSHAKALFKPLFRAGDTVMDLAPNRKRRIGRVLADAVTHTPPSRKSDFSVHQAVLVEFESEIMTLVLPPAKLELVPLKAEK